VDGGGVDGGVSDEAMVKKRSLASLREWVDHSRQRLDEWQKQVDSKIRNTIDGISQAVTPWSSINKDVKTLADRIEELEAKLRELEAHESSKQ
jgi:polyhydroxyalkanoate synthesis regulator phasin